MLPSNMKNIILNKYFNFFVAITYLICLVMVVIQDDFKTIFGLVLYLGNVYVLIYNIVIFRKRK
jgi:hypothetical protein